MRRSLYFAGALALTTGVVQAQGPVRTYSYSTDRDDRDRPAIGITTSSGGMRDTLGLLVSSVTAGGPADKAGIEEGNRLAAINGVSLRLSASDAGEGDMADVVSRRLVRELEKVKAGDEVELRVWAGGQTKAVKVKTVAMEDLPSRTRNVRREMEDRPVLGLSLSATGSRRDTLGMLVVRVTTNGPAEKAGLIEGDRISAINGVSLRVAPEDAGDGYMSSARMNRYRRELAKVTVGEDVELRVVSNGQTKTVRIKPVRAGDLPRDRGGVMIIGDGAIGFGDLIAPMPSISIPAVPGVPPRPGARIYEFDGNGMRIGIDPELRMRIEDQARDAERRARDIMERFQNFRFDYDRRADDLIATPAPTPPASRPRSGTRISTTGSGVGSGVGYGYVLANDDTPALAYAPDARTVSGTGGTVYAEPAVRWNNTGSTSSTGSNVAVFDGDQATFMLQGLRLARVNDDLAENLGHGSQRGFLILDAGSRWSGLKSGDVLLEVDGRAVRDGNAARIELSSTDEHTAQVIREGRQRTVSVDVR